MWGEKTEHRKMSEFMLNWNFFNPQRCGNATQVSELITHAVNTSRKQNWRVVKFSVVIAQYHILDKYVYFTPGEGSKNLWNGKRNSIWSRQCHLAVSITRSFFSLLRPTGARTRDIDIPPDILLSNLCMFCSWDEKRSTSRD